MRRAVCALFGFALALVANDAATENFNLARSLTVGGDFEEVTTPIMNIRDQLASLSIRKRDYSQAKFSRTSTPDSLLVMLSQAEHFVAINDKENAIRTLDMAYFAAIDLITKQTPAQRLASALAHLENEKAAHGGTASPVSLLRAARAEYLAGDFVRSQQLAMQATQCPLGSQGAALVHSEFIVAGLSESKLGNEQQAGLDLMRSVQALGPAVGGVLRFDLSLAKVLVKQQPAVVIAFLDSAALHPEWKDRAKVPLWKSQIEAGESPDFGDAILSVP